MRRGRSVFQIDWRENVEALLRVLSELGEDVARVILDTLVLSRSRRLKAYQREQRTWLDRIAGYYRPWSGARTRYLDESVGDDSRFLYGLDNYFANSCRAKDVWGQDCFFGGIDDYE